MVGRLVEQQHIGPCHQGLRQRHAFGIPPESVPTHVGRQVQTVQRFLYALLPGPVQRPDLALQGVQIALALGCIDQ